MALICMVTALFVLASCEGGSESVSYTVHFDVSHLSYAVTVPADLTVAAGETVTAPALNGESAAGLETIWTTEPTAPTRYDFTKAVAADLTLYAVEVPKTYKIVYLVEEEKGQNSAQNPATYDGSKAVTLADPIAAFGYRFVKWSYFDDQESAVTNIAAGSKGDVILRAVFAPRVYAMIYSDVNGAVNTNPASYTFGDRITLADLSLDGNEFIGFTARYGQSLVVTEITPEFLEAHHDELINGGICLRANWRDEE